MTEGENGEVRSSQEEEDRLAGWKEELTDQGGYSFDEVARGLATGALSRRQALKMAAGALLGSMLGIFSIMNPAQAKRRRRFRCIVGSIVPGGNNCPSRPGAFPCLLHLDAGSAGCCLPQDLCNTVANAVAALACTCQGPLPPECTDNEDCPPGQVCVNGACVPPGNVCSPPCPQGSTCLPTGQCTCPTGVACPPGQQCVNGVCVPIACQTDADCGTPPPGAHFECVGGQCILVTCTEQCAADQCCLNGQCVSTGTCKQAINGCCLREDVLINVCVTGSQCAAAGRQCTGGDFCQPPQT